jgi:hypothetical protein
MVVAYAGRLPGAADFPEDNVSYVAEQIGRLISNLRPRVVVGSAAAGADLLVLEAALKAGSSAKVVLAGSTAQHRMSSVVGRGVTWERLFDETVEHEHVDVLEVPRHDDDDETYSSVNKMVRDLAEAEVGDPDKEPIVGINVSARREGADLSADMAVAQELRQRLVLCVDPSRRQAETPTAFVAMPFGRRVALDSGFREYEADATYKRIILPALIDAGYRPVRADAEALLEVIDVTMLHAINSADVVVADLATLNANVMWEVGVRHAWRRSGTILIRPHGTTPPFDVSHARVHPYKRNETFVGDNDAVAGIELLRGLLTAISEERVDSPVFMTLPDLDEPHLVMTSTDHGDDPSDLIEAIGLAADLRDLAALQRVAAEVKDDARLPDTAREPLLEQIGLAFVGAGSHAAAAAVLGPLAERDTTMEHVRLQQQYAHALIRSDEADGRAERLELAETRLRALIARGSRTGETLGLLGSAAKARVEMALAAGESPGAHLNVALNAYLDGFRRDPGDYYPGLVALALLRLRGQHLQPSVEDVEQARALLPVVRFAVTRLGEPSDNDVWRVATVAELHLHEYLLTNDEEDLLVRATAQYARLAAVGGPSHRASAARQLQLFRDAGDPPDVLDAILEQFR